MVMKEPYAMPAMPGDVKDGILNGMYRFRASENKKSKLRAQLFGSGAILREALQAQELLESKFGVAADVWSVTSYKGLYRDALDADRWNRLHPGEKPRLPYVTECLADVPGVLVAASDYLKALPNLVSKWMPRALLSQIVAKEWHNRYFRKRVKYSAQALRSRDGGFRGFISSVLVAGPHAQREFFSGRLSSMSAPAQARQHDLASLKIEERSRTTGKAGRRLGLFAAGLGLFVLAVGGVLVLRGQKPVVEVAAARPAGDRRADALLNASGYVTPRRRATIAAKITGRVTSVLFDEGVRVREGQVLATLDDSDAKRALDAAKADRDAAQATIADYEVQLKNAEITLHRAQALQAAGVQTQEALDNARTATDSLKAKIALSKQQVAAAEARIQEAQQNVDNTVIRAPFAGIVVSKDAQVGEMVSPISAGGGFTRTGIATIVDMNSNEIEVDVNEAYIARVVPGQKVVATLDAYPDWQIPCKVRTVIPTADRQKATVKVRISFDKLDPKILPYMGVKFAFLGNEPVAQKGKGSAAKALIPQSAVRQHGGNSLGCLVCDA